MADEAPGGGQPGFSVDVVGGVLAVSLNRPEVGNALTSDAIHRLGEVFLHETRRDDVRVLLMRAEGPAFCAGGDVKAFAATIDRPPEERRLDYRARMDRARVQMEAYLGLPVPIVVACQGAVAGAAVSYPLGADVVLAEPGTRFVFPHQRLGLPPDGGLSHLLPRVVGVRKATELVLTAATIDAEEALRLGIVSQIVSAEELQPTARSLAERLAKAPTGAVRQARQLLRDSQGRSAGEQLAAERDAVAEAVAGSDFVEGVRAFLEKRRPVFPSDG